MTEKDWEIYTKLAKEMDVYFLRGNSKDYEINGCKITFYSVEDLISKLQSQASPALEADIKLLIEQIYLMTNKRKDKDQKSLLDYIN